MSTQAAAGDRYKTLAANTALISFGTLGSKLMVFFMVRLHTGYMSPADYGTADIITQTANLLVPLVSFGMAEAVFRFAAGRPGERREVFTAGILCTAAGLALLAAFLPLLRRTELIGCHGLLLTVYVAASCLHSMCAQYVRALGDTPGYTLQGLINTALVIGFNILLLAVFRLGMTGYVLSVAAADTGCSLWLIVRKRLWNELSLHIGKPLFIRLISYSVPLIPTSVFWWITGVSDRYMISGFLGSAANGIYAVSGKIPTMLTILSTVFMDAWQLSAVLGAGWIAGMLLAVTVLSDAFTGGIYKLSSMFLGFVIVSIPLVVIEQKEVMRSVRPNLIYLAAGIALVIALSAINLSSSVNGLGFGPGTAAYVFAAGVLAISAMVLPGISGSSMLMSFGLYLPVISAVKSVLGFNFSELWMLIVLALGIAAGLAVSPHILKKLMERNMGSVMYMVLGMMIGSVYAIIIGPTTLKVPQHAMGLSDFSIVWFIIGILSVLALSMFKAHAGRRKAMSAL